MVREMQCWSRAIGVIAMLGSFFPGAATAADARPNILFIAIDDMRPILGSLANEKGGFLSEYYPNASVRASVAARVTPNLDRLAARGVTFTQAYCAAPLCVPSRLSILTGMLPARTNVFRGNGTPIRQLPKKVVREAVTLPQRLRQGGYFAVGIGKIFHASAQIFDGVGNVFEDGPDVAHSWDVWVNRPIGTHRKVIPSQWAPVARKFLSYGTEDGAKEDQYDWRNAGFVADLLRDGEALDRATGEVVRLPEDQPAFIACGINRPHAPWVVPQEFIDRFPLREMKVPRKWLEDGAEDLEDVPAVTKARIRAAKGAGNARKVWREGIRIGGRNGGRLAIAEALRHYLAAQAFADECVGLILDALENSPLRDNTVVVLFSDHGGHLGQKTHFGKETLWEASTRSTLLIADLRPGSAGGIRENVPVSLVDIYPTVCAFAGLATPREVEGESLVPALRGDALKADRTILSMVGWGSFSIRVGRWRYTTMMGSKHAELYNIKADPGERNNLLAKPSPRIRRLEKEMRQAMRAVVSRSRQFRP